MKNLFTPTWESMRGLLARLYQPLDITDNPSLTNRSSHDTVEHSAAFQEQEQEIAYEEYVKWQRYQPAQQKELSI